MDVRRRRLHIVNSFKHLEDIHWMCNGQYLKYLEININGTYRQIPQDPGPTGTVIRSDAYYNRKPSLARFGMIQNLRQYRSHHLKATHCKFRLETDIVA